MERSDRQTLENDGCRLRYLLNASMHFSAASTVSNLWVRREKEGDQQTVKSKTTQNPSKPTQRDAKKPCSSRTQRQRENEKGNPQHKPIS
jgi:hypothetical protein